MGAVATATPKGGADAPSTDFQNFDGHSKDCSRHEPRPVFEYDRRGILWEQEGRERDQSGMENIPRSPQYTPPTGTTWKRGVGCEEGGFARRTSIEDGGLLRVPL